MGRSEENTGFTCIVCEKTVRPLTNGSYRNHCPFCLASLHVDISEGDRAADCAGVMDAVDVRLSRKGWQIIHRCRRCGATKANRVALDGDQPDDAETLGRLSSRPAMTARQPSRRSR